MVKRKIWIMVILVFIIITTSLSYYEIYVSYNNLTQNNYTIENNKVNKDINLVIISDLHANQLGEDNKELINKIKVMSPDAILVVGDMINEDSINSEIVTTLMKQLTKNHKVYYSLGNTETDYIQSGKSDLIKELEKVGVTVLNNEYKDVKINKTTIRIGGMYSYAFGMNGNNNIDKDTMDEGVYDFLKNFQNTQNYKIMMAHRPDSFIFGNASKVWDIDLVVSGHTHGGQVRLPFIGGLYGGDQGWFPQYDKGLFDLNKMKILISSGLGSGKQKLPRFNNPPEVVNLKLTD